MKNFNKLYYILTFTWGILSNILGALVVLFFVPIFKATVETRYGRWVFVGGKYWGGLSLGNFVFLSSDAAKDTFIISHEIGHSLQNILWGPLFLFVIGLPSMVRYWLIDWGWIKVKDYDDIWFEGQATEWGKQCVDAYDKSEEV